MLEHAADSARHWVMSTDTAALYAAADRWAAAAGAVTPADWAADPLGWASGRAGLALWSKQREVMTAVRDHRRVAVRSCNSAGKTAVAAAVAAHWIDAHPPGEAFVLTSAPTGSQVKVLLWREINRLHRSAHLPGRTNLTEWYIDGELVAFGRKPSEHDAAAFLGTHALHILVIFDEADGIPAVLWAAAESVASNAGARILAIGNPHDPDSTFATVCEPGSGWHVIGIGYGDTPNFTGEAVSARLSDLLISPTWVTARAAEWGEDSALYSAMCLGQFPARGADAFTVIPWAMAARCRGLDLDPTGPHEGGIDVGAGGDETVFAERRGPVVGTVVSFRDADPMATVGRLVVAIAESGVEKVRVDVTGIGRWFGVTETGWTGSCAPHASRSSTAAGRSRSRPRPTSSHAWVAPRTARTRSCSPSTPRRPGPRTPAPWPRSPTPPR